MTASAIQQLIEESADLERKGASIQRDDRTIASEHEIDAFVAAYHDWYARALDVLPEEFEDRFRDEFKSGTFKGHRIEDFLKAPGAESPLYNAEEPSPIFPYWQHPYDAAVRGPILNQRQILAEARQRLEGPGESSQHIELIERLCRNVPEFLEPFGNRRAGRQPFVIEDEYDLQTGLHGILNLFFEDVRSEDYVPEHGGSRSRLDFLLKSEKIVVETKMTRKGLAKKEVGEELMVDINRYKAHPDCGALVALVFDPDKRIQNRRALERGLSRKSDGLTVRVYVVQ